MGLKLKITRHNCSMSDVERVMKREQCGLDEALQIIKNADATEQFLDHITARVEETLSLIWHMAVVVFWIGLFCLTLPFEGANWRVRRKLDKLLGV